MTAKPSAAVVGAGLAGLTAAHRLQQAGWEVTVFEAEETVGGRVRTLASAGYLLDVGASGVGESYRAYFDLAGELGLEEEIQPCSPYFGVFRDGRIHLLRLDRMIRSGASTRLLSWRSKLRVLRLAADVLRAKARGRLDYADMRKAAPLDTESSRAYATRALNPEIDAYLCEPIVRTMLIADSDKVSKVELFSGIANIFGSRIYALRGGQGRLPDALAEHVEVKTGSAVTCVASTRDGVALAYRDAGGADRLERFDGCVVTCPLPIATEICPDHRVVLEPLNEALGYTSCISVEIGTTTAPRSPAFLVQLPSREDPDIALVFLEHNKAADRAPAGHGLLHCCWETDAAARMLEASDEAIVERTMETVLRLFPELEGTVDLTHVTRWKHALPHTRIGAYKRIGEFNAALDPASPIQFAADFMSAAGQNTAVEFGTRAARRLAALPGVSNLG